MASGKRDQTPRGCRICRLIFILLILLIASCRTGARQPGSVLLEDKEYEEATALLEKINRLNEQGQYGEAIFAAERLCKIVEAEKGENHQGVGVCLNVLGGLYDSFGDYEKAEIALRRGLEINRGLIGKDSTLLAASLGLLAKVFMDKGEYRQAEPYALEALRIREQMRGGDDFMVSTSLNTLGEIYLHLKEYQKAEPLLLRAVEIRRKHENAHSLVISLNNICRLYYETGYDPAAEQLGSTTLELGEDALGQNHPHLAETLNLLGKTVAAQGRFQEAFQYLKRAQAIDFESIDDMKGFASEAQKLKFMQKRQEDLQVFLSLILEKLSESPEALREGMNTILRRKGIILDVQRQFQKSFFTGNRKTIETFHRLSEARTELTRLAFAGPGQESLEAYRKKIDRLREKKEQLEIQISSANRSYRLYRKKAAATCRRVADQLMEKGDCALVEFIRVRLYRFEADPDRRWGGDHYFAFILKAGDPYDLNMVDLGSADSIDEMIFQLKSALFHSRSQAEKAVPLWAGRLYEKAFLPIQKLLADRTHIYLAPDGSLNLIPFEIFFNPDSGFLIEKYTFNYVSCGRDLLAHEEISPKRGKVLLIGDPDFDRRDGAPASAEGKTAKSDVEKDPGFRAPLLSRDLRFDRLPGTRAEVLSIQALWGKDQTELYLGEHATEDVLRNMAPPRILHLATHGFFLEDLALEPSDSSSSNRGLSVAPQNGAESSAGGIPLEYPLLRSGFVLAGANLTLKSHDTKNFDGVVTAEKILGLKLMNTDMVVLSACNTGVGEVKTGEGVFGLRRVFSQAGAKSLVMSMWSVPDRETRELMVAFYTQILSGTMNRCQALRQAALGELEVAKTRYGFPNPLFWGSFIFLGEP